MQYYWKKWVCNQLTEKMENQQGTLGTEVLDQPKFQLVDLFYHTHIADEKKCFSLIIFSRLLSLAYNNQEAVPASIATWQCPWLPEFFCNLLLTPLSLLDKKKGETALLFFCVMPSSSLFSFVSSSFFLLWHFFGWPESHLESSLWHFILSPPDRNLSHFCNRIITNNGSILLCALRHGWETF